jgi:EF hand
MKSKWMTAALLLAGGAVANAADAPGGAPPGGGGGGGGMGGMMRMAPEERFKMMDANGDGKVSFEEYQAAQARMRGPGGPPPGGPPPGAGQGQPPAGGPPGGGMMNMSPEERFKMMDANGDKSVTLDEYKAMMERMRAMMGGPGGPPPAGGKPQ